LNSHCYLDLSMINFMLLLGIRVRVVAAPFYIKEANALESNSSAPLVSIDKVGIQWPNDLVIRQWKR
jgi:biotin-(acetyl-CoA carboxylase) ligase